MNEDELYAERPRLRQDVPFQRPVMMPPQEMASGPMGRETTLPQGLDANAARMADPTFQAAAAEQSPALARAAEFREAAALERAKADTKAQMAMQATPGRPVGGVAFGEVPYGTAMAKAPKADKDPYEELAALAAEVKRSKAKKGGRRA